MAEEKGEKVTLNFTRETGSNSGTLAYPINLKTGSTSNTDYVRFKFYKYNPPFGAIRGEGERSGVSRRGIEGYNRNTSVMLPDDDLLPIFLYVPEDIQSAYGAQWGGKSIQNLTASALSSVANTIGEGANLLGFAEQLSNTLGSAGEAIPAQASKMLIDALQKVGQGEGLNINDVLSSTGGIVLNPNVELLFSGFELRNFNLNFKMVARSANEALEIKKIINTFKKGMLPSYDGGSSNESDGNNTDPTASLDGISALENTASYIRVPSLIDVKFMRGGAVNPFISQYKPCAITSFVVNYTADGSYATYKDGEPVAVLMQIGFTETKLVYREDINVNGAGASY